MPAVWPEPSPADLLPWWGHSCLRGLPVLVYEVSKRAWGLRLRRTDHGLALSFLFMLPSAHVNRVGVRVVSFRSSIAHPAYTPVYASLSPSRYQRKTRGRVDRWSFLVRILHSLLHAGLSRRTNIAITIIAPQSSALHIGELRGYFSIPHGENINTTQM